MSAIDEAVEVMGRAQTAIAEIREQNRTLREELERVRDVLFAMLSSKPPARDAIKNALGRIGAALRKELV